jgi:hypothetical protein
MSEDKSNDWQTRIQGDIAYFLSTLSPEMREKLDYSAESLKVLETWLLEQYDDSDAFLVEESKAVDGIVFYVGETYKQHFGGYWKLDPKRIASPRAFSENVLLVGFAEEDEEISPYEHILDAVSYRETALLKVNLEFWVNATRASKDES